MGIQKVTVLNIKRSIVGPSKFTLSIPLENFALNVRPYGLLLDNHEQVTQLAQEIADQLGLQVEDLTI